MTFRESFDAYVCEGDVITTEADGFTVTARIVRDDIPDAPDKRQDGFWPTLDPQDAGYIGAGKTHADLETTMARAKSVMEAWEADEWFYCGIVVCVSRAGVTLDDHAASLWGIEANYPDSDNAYLSEVANQLLPEALETARAALARLCAGCGYTDAEAAA
ncbi:hypothetical protein GCM10007853_17430 [Algimonas ampicilliniresistens]|uniref:Uncharacterized protein n=1 Tax=Algimonas ampicilliniresistens TaxID=1298735 RepID=A0ABQ5V8M3_9PROT|nr:hypothetical protein [Algimonas ampicilliniresistens]GLQ23869.1 hypothetical protein GCM10007853_17430 [Algimonas ampicilliniresistens]